VQYEVCLILRVLSLPESKKTRHLSLWQVCTTVIGGVKKGKCSVFENLTTWQKLLMDLRNRFNTIKALTNALIQH
jgi:hypothetical protein